MLPTFLAQLAAGSAIATACAPIQQVSWKYLRLMAILTLCLGTLALALMFRESDGSSDPLRRYGMFLLGGGSLIVAGWIFLNALQGESVKASQRMAALLGGAIWLAAVVLLAVSPDRMVESLTTRTTRQIVASSASVLLGAGLLGSATAAMLLGHRYLTDTGMSIAPLRRLTAIFLGAVVARGAWVLVATLPVWSGSFTPRGSYTWFWLMVCVRIGVGVIGTGIFAWMVWDCVKRRSTQSATAIFYLSMIFIFLGELSGQYLLRSETLAL